MDMNAIVTTERAARGRLAQTLKSIVSDAEHLLKSVQKEGTEEFNAARGTFETQLEHAKSELAQLERDASYHAKQALRSAAHAVHDHPYATVGIAAFGACILIGILASRR